VTHTDSRVADYVDLGSSLAFGMDPTSNTALLDALRGLNTCSGPVPAGVTSVSTQATHPLTIPAAGPGKLIELNWDPANQHNVISLVWRPDGAAPTFSTPSAASSDTLGVFSLDLPSGRVIALTWPTADGNRLVLPPGITPLADSPGAAVLSPPSTPFDAKVTFHDEVAATKKVS
jgi:hypothetical protein